MSLGALFDLLEVFLNFYSHKVLVEKLQSTPRDIKKHSQRHRKALLETL
jgi:hypothetical protein